MGLALLLCGFLTVTDRTEPLVSPDGAISRDHYGGEEREYRITVDGLWEEPVPITVTVGARTYTEAEAGQVFTEIMDGMSDRIRGDNPSLMEVRRDLVLPGWLEEYGVRLRWSSSFPELLDSSGHLKEKADALDDPDGQVAYLGVQLRAGDYKEEYEIPVRVLPKERTPRQSAVDGLERRIREQEEAQRTEEWLSLPAEYDGKPLRYQAEEQAGYGGLLLLGALAAVLCYARERAADREQRQRRERELLLDYAELLSKLMVFTGAGMTLRGAWERMVGDYEKAVKSGKQKRRAAYEEMGQTWHQLQSGMPEGTAYREFGNRCGLPPYLKLSSLLEQNRKTGTKNLRGILQMEMADAFEQRKNLARRLGEEAGTKLLLPLFMLLGIVMVMIMVPAMMTMG